MSQRHRSYFPHDEGALHDGDGSMIGVDMRRDPVVLGNGLAALARNMRFDQQTPETRLGPGLLRWGNSYGAAFPLEFPLTWDLLVGFDDVLGAGVWYDLAGTEWVLMATRDAVYIGRESFPLVRLSLPDGEINEEACFFVQAVDEVYLFRGPRKRTLRWAKNYLQAPPWYEGFTYLVADPIAGTAQIPDAFNAVAMSDRLFVPLGREEFVSSDILDFRRYSLTDGVHRATDTADRLVRLFPFGNTTLTCFGERSVTLFMSVTGDLSQMYRDELTRELGLAAPLSVATVGADVFFLSSDGVYTVRQVLDNRLQGTSRPLSEPIQPLINRIQWRHVEQAVAAYWNNRYFLAVPLDESEINNAVLVYDVLNGAWCGADDGPTIHPKAFVKASVRGRQRLLMFDYSGLVYLYEEHLGDEGGAGFVEIESELLTRGYLCGSTEEKLFGRATLDLETWRPAYSIAAESPNTAEAPR